MESSLSDNRTTCPDAFVEPCSWLWRAVGGAVAVISVSLLIHLISQYRSHPAEIQLVLLLGAGPVLVAATRVNLVIMFTAALPDQEAWPFSSWPTAAAFYAMSLLALTVFSGDSNPKGAVRARATVVVAVPATGCYLATYQVQSGHLTLISEPALG